MWNFSRVRRLAFWLIIGLLIGAPLACVWNRLAGHGVLDDPRDVGFALTPTGAALMQNPRRLPITVAIHPNATAWAETVQDAVIEWNSTLGFNAFIFLGVGPEEMQPSPGFLPVHIDGNVHNTAHTLFLANQTTGEILIAALLLPSGEFSRSVATLVVMHELGHALGLDHDPELPMSLMHPKIADSTPRPTNLDVRRLKEAYARKSPFDDDEILDLTPPIPPRTSSVSESQPE